MVTDFDYQEVHIKTSRGVQLFTCRWLPASSSPKALLFLCHGYGMECSNSMKDVGIRLSRKGYAVIGIDYEGHGKSSGARCYIKRFDDIVDVCNQFFKSVCAEKDFRDKPRFLLGESMGGAVALLLHKKEPTFYNGGVLVAPMCKIADELKPHPAVTSVLSTFENIIPTWRIVPSKDVIDSAFKDPVKREAIRSSKLIYQDRPRLKTALEMLRTSLKLEKTLHDVKLPLLILHGEADIVTDPKISKALYEQASSKDKTLKLYPGMCHGLMIGEFDENAEIVFADIIAWLDKRSNDASNLVMEPISENFESGIQRIKVDESADRQPPKVGARLNYTHPEKENLHSSM